MAEVKLSTRVWTGAALQNNVGNGKEIGSDGGLSGVLEENSSACCRCFIEVLYWVFLKGKKNGILKENTQG